jgi:hypothetical protein
MGKEKGMARVQLGRYEIEHEDLPNLCLRCGRPAVVHKSRRFAWHPPWVGLLLLAGLIPYAVVALIFARDTGKRPRC